MLPDLYQLNDEQSRESLGRGKFPCSVRVQMLLNYGTHLHGLFTRHPVAEQSKKWVCDRSIATIAGSNPTGYGCLSLANVVCCQVEVSATDRSRLQRCPTECGVLLSGIL